MNGSYFQHHTNPNICSASRNAAMNTDNPIEQEWPIGTEVERDHIGRGVVAGYTSGDDGQFVIVARHGGGRYSARAESLRRPNTRSE